MPEALLRHAQHIHVGAENICPSPAADDNGDGLIDTVEGQPLYGGIEVSLTTEGDVGEASALAVERFPVASADGVISYSRTFDLPPGTTVDELSQGVIVQHGISELFADPLQYDGEPRSSIAPDQFPLEATIPTDCGALAAVDTLPTTGVGVAVPTEHDLPLAALSAVLALGALGVLRTRRI